MSTDVVYSDVNFVKKGSKNQGLSSPNQDNATYAEVRKWTPKTTGSRSEQDDEVTYSTVTILRAPRKPSETSSQKDEEDPYNEVQTGSEPKVSSPGLSTVTKRVLIGVFVCVLLAAVVAVVIVMYSKERTNEFTTNRNMTTTTTETGTNAFTTNRNMTTTTTETGTNAFTTNRNMTSTTTKTTTSTTSKVPTCTTKLHCDSDWNLNGPKCFYFSTNKLSWIQSKDKCETLGGRLVKIKNKKKQRFLAEKLRSLMTEDEDKFWIGLTDSETEGEWKWTDGSSLDQNVTFWFTDTQNNKGEPDNWKGVNNKYPEGEDCVRMGEKGFEEKCWFDKDCNALQKYICEKNPTQSPDCQ